MLTCILCGKEVFAANSRIGIWLQDVPLNDLGRYYKRTCSCGAVYEWERGFQLQYTPEMLAALSRVCKTSATISDEAQIHG